MVETRSYADRPPAHRRQHHSLLGADIIPHRRLAVYDLALQLGSKLGHHDPQLRTLNPELGQCPQSGPG
jgi:hypothetical protein